MKQVKIISVTLSGFSNPKRRRVTVLLSNGTRVHILPMGDGQPGFQQVDCTAAEAAVTIDVALHFNDWLNGANL